MDFSNILLIFVILGAILGFLVLFYSINRARYRKIEKAKEKPCNHQFRNEIIPYGRPFGYTPCILNPTHSVVSIHTLTDNAAKAKKGRAANEGYWVKRCIYCNGLACYAVHKDYHP